MALKRTNIPFDNGLAAVETYERIVGVTISRSKSGGDVSVAVNINLGLWTSKARSDAGNQAVEHSSIALRGAEADPFVATGGGCPPVPTGQGSGSQWDAQRRKYHERPGDVTDILAKAYIAIKAHEPVRGEPDYRTASDV